MKILLLILMLFSVRTEAEPITLSNEQQIQIAILIQQLQDEIHKLNHQLGEALRDRNEYYAKSRKQCI